LSAVKKNGYMGQAPTKLEKGKSPYVALTQTKGGKKGKEEGNRGLIQSKRKFSLASAGTDCEKK